MPDAAEIRRAAALLRAGRLVAFPTETVYGLGANALDPDAVARIYAAKGRPPSSPLIVHVDSLAMARSLAAAWPAAAETLARRWWPGPLTLVLPKAPHVPSIVTANLDTVGLRMPAHPIALALIRETGLPIAAPSANRFTRLSPTRAEHVRDAFGDSLDLVLDGGPCPVGLESTVVSLAGPQPVLLRPGMVTASDLEAVLGPLCGSVPDTASHPSPGLHPRHYSPRTPLCLGLPPSGRAIYLYLTTPPAGAPSQRMPSDPAAYAAVLYDTLHGLDRAGWDWIAVEPPPDTPAWAAVRDRLRRAAYPPTSPSAASRSSGRPTSRQDPSSA